MHDRPLADREDGSLGRGAINRGSGLGHANAPVSDDAVGAATYSMA
ncbi:hypothetical protein [Celeribacter neptunius]|nr:hypothetical protein [Celeribacter neptunius]